MKIQLEQLWSSSFQPWLSDEPWNTVTPVIDLTLSNPLVTVKSGVMYIAGVSVLTLSKPTEAIKTGFKHLASVAVITLSNPVSMLTYGIRFLAEVSVLTVSLPTVTIKAGFKCLCETVATITLSNPTSTLKYGVKYLADVSSLVLSSPTPQRIGALWERIVKTTGEIWTNINKGTAIWESYGTILWSWRNSPWLSTYQPWLEDGGAKPVTNYEGTPDVTTNYLGGNKPTTIIYDNINKPNN